MKIMTKGWSCKRLGFSNCYLVTYYLNYDPMYLKLYHHSDFYIQNASQQNALQTSYVI